MSTGSRNLLSALEIPKARAKLAGTDICAKVYRAKMDITEEASRTTYAIAVSTGYDSRDLFNEVTHLGGIVT